MFGAVVFCIWEDIVACNQKMILVFVCALNQIAKEKKAGGAPEESKDDTSVV